MVMRFWNCLIISSYHQLDEAFGWKFYDMVIFVDLTRDHWVRHFEEAMQYVNWFTGTAESFEHNETFSKILCNITVPLG